MNKVSVKIIALCMATAMAFSVVFCGCGNSDKKSDSNASSSGNEVITAESFKGGNYEPIEIIMGNGEKITYDEYVDRQAEKLGYKKDSDEYKSFKDTMVIEYKFDKSGAVVGTQGGVAVKGVYTVDEDEVDLALGSNKVVMTYDCETNTLIASDMQTRMSTVFGEIKE